MKDTRLNRLRKAGWAVLGVLLVVGGAVLVVSVLRDNSVQQPHTITTVMRVVLPPPPPPPPQPPPPPPPPQPQKMLEQPKDMTQAPPTPAPKPIAKPAAAKPSAAPSPPGNPLTADAAPGANPYGLQVGNGEGDVIGGGGGGGGGSEFGYYASLIQSQVHSALQQDDKTRSGHYRLTVRLWLNATGQVIRSQVVDSSGNTLTDSAISKVLDAVSIGEGPPQNMPQPINVQINAQS